jgi:hypothetical protein
VERGFVPVVAVTAHHRHHHHGAHHAKNARARVAVSGSWTQSLAGWLGSIAW